MFIILKVLKGPLDRRAPIEEIEAILGGEATGDKLVKVRQANLRSRSKRDNHIMNSIFAEMSCTPLVDRPS